MAGQNESDIDIKTTSLSEALNAILITQSSAKTAEEQLKDIIAQLNRSLRIIVLNIRT